MSERSKVGIAGTDINEGDLLTIDDDGNVKSWGSNAAVQAVLAGRRCIELWPEIKKYHDLMRQKLSRSNYWSRRSAWRAARAKRRRKKELKKMPYQARLAIQALSPQEIYVQPLVASTQTFAVNIFGTIQI